MNEQFRQHIEFQHPSFEVLLSSAPFQFASLPKSLPKAGVYLFSDGEQHLYAGRTNSIRKRLSKYRLLTNKTSNNDERAILSTH